MKPSHWTLLIFVLINGIYLACVVRSVAKKQTHWLAGLLVWLVVFAATGWNLGLVWNHQRLTERRQEWRRAHPGEKPSYE